MKKRTLLGRQSFFHLYLLFVACTILPMNYIVAPAWPQQCSKQGGVLLEPLFSVYRHLESIQAPGLICAFTAGVEKACNFFELRLALRFLWCCVFLALLVLAWEVSNQPWERSWSVYQPPEDYLDILVAAGRKDKPSTWFTVLNKDVASGLKKKKKQDRKEKKGWMVGW